MAAVMWGSEVVDIALDGRLDRFGIRPRRLDGLAGIIFAPFLHGGFGHLIANTIPFLILGGPIALGNLARFVQVTAILPPVAGLGTLPPRPHHPLPFPPRLLAPGLLPHPS